jgi:DHA1 family tetracycline resistance protein-like MFS transporter
MPFGAREVAESFALAGVVVVGTQLWLYPRALARFGERATLALGFAAAALGFASLPFAAPGRSLSLAIAVTALGTAFSRPALTAWLSRTTPDGRQGEVMGLLQSLQSAAQLAGPLLTGALIGQGLYRSWAWGVGALHAAGLALVLGWTARSLGAQGAEAGQGVAAGARTGEAG